MDEKTQRDFLRDAATSNLPIIYFDGAATHVVYLARVRFSSPHKPGEAVAQLVFIEAQRRSLAGRYGRSRYGHAIYKAQPTVWQEQLHFLHEAEGDTEPILYHGPDGKWRRLYVTQLMAQSPHKGPAGLEPVVQLRMIELDRRLSLAGRYGRSSYGRAIYGG